MTAGMGARVRRESGRLAGAAGSLEALSPLSTLARGYAVPLGSDGRLLRTVRSFPPGLNFGLRVADGYVPAVVTGPARMAPAPREPEPARGEREE